MKYFAVPVVLWAAIGFALLLLPNTVTADVIESESDGFQIRISTIVNCDCDSAYEMLVNDFSKWWDASHSYTGNAENLSLDIERHCMLEQLPREGFVRHMEIVSYQPGKVFRMAGGLGPLQEMGVAGALSFVFEKVDKGTQVVLTYNVAGAARQSLDKIAGPVDGVLVSQLDRFKKHCNEVTGSIEKSAANVSVHIREVSIVGEQGPDKSAEEQDAESKSDAEKAAEMLQHDVGVWDCTWDYLDADGEVFRTVTGVETMKASLDGKVIEMETFIPEGELTSKSLRFYNSTTNKLTLLSVGPDGNHWELNQEIESSVMISEPHPTRRGGKELIRFTTTESTANTMKVTMEMSRNEKPWVKVFRQTLVRRK